MNDQNLTGRRGALILRLILMAAFGPVLLVLAAGPSFLTWTMGWIFAAFSFVFALFSRLFILRKNPGLIAERADSLKKDNVEPWDRILVPILGIFLPTAAVILAGLDRRFGWSPAFPLWLQAGSYVLMVGGAFLSMWAAVENAFFSAVVRIQDDRGQTVVCSGPYRFIRHPGYTGGLLFHLSIPLALGSIWTFLPISVNAVLTVIRTSLEDRILQKKLGGYREYAQKTKSRLIPGIW
jgi:protein-S-isoprenylcysteine O-methyltransferase Ste14